MHTHTIESFMLHGVCVADSIKYHHAKVQIHLYMGSSNFVLAQVRCLTPLPAEVGTLSSTHPSGDLHPAFQPKGAFQGRAEPYSILKIV